MATGGCFWATGNLGARSAEFRADKVVGVAGSSFTWLDFFRQHGNYLKPSSMSTMSLIGVAMRGMLITLSVYTAILAAMLWAMQVGGILPAAKDASEWQGHPQRIESLLLFVGLIVSGAFLLFGIASWLGSIPTKAAVFIGAVPPILFVIAAVWLLRSPDGSVALNTEESALALARRPGIPGGRRCLPRPACGGPRTTTTRRAAASHVVHKWQYRVRIIYQQVLGPCSPDSRCWLPCGACRTSTASSTRSSVVASRPASRVRSSA